MDKVIVIGNNHHNTLGLVRSLGRAGMEVTCLIVESTRKSFVLNSIYIKHSRQFQNVDEVLVFLLNEVKSDEKIPILTTSDQIAECLDLHYDELKIQFALCNCENTQGGIGKWMDKGIMLQTAKEIGFTIPYSLNFDIREDNKSLLKEIPFPCIIKPEKSSHAGKENVRVCHNANQTSSAFEDIKGNCNKVIIQEYIDRDYEFLIMGMRSRKSNTIVLPGGLHKLRTCKKTKSLGMFAYAYTTPEIDRCIDKSAIQRFLERIDYDGIFSIEFMIANEKAYFLEINLRNDGTQFCFEGAGVNLPQLWAMASIGEDISHFNKVLEKKYCMVEANYLKNMDWHHPITAIKELWETNLFALFDRKDWKPALYKLKYAGDKLKIIVLGG